MTAGTIEIESSWHKQFTLGHIALIFGAALVLTLFLFVKNPQYFKVSLFGQNETSHTSDVALHYQPYTPTSEPAVLGASTTDDLGPEVLNEDGTIVSAADPGAVLGANTEQLATDLASVDIRTTVTTPSNVRSYLETMSYWESSAIDQTAFESALTSNNQTQINTQVQEMQDMLYYLQDMVVPNDAAQLHKLKIVQYRSAMILLQNFSQADSNPQLVTDQLGLFLSSQERQNQETTNLQQKYNL